MDPHYVLILTLLANNRVSMTRLSCYFHYLSFKEKGKVWSAKKKIAYKTVSVKWKPQWLKKLISIHIFISYTNYYI